ncbi:MAG: Gfo/Idh/MocA family oxidoreductase, partial [Clostridia bacterium]|nr:Gfo/Idh/MocA family oxidoreductase [Clostridia bacterium]
MKRLGVIGIGRMGSRHARNLAKGAIAGGRLVAVCDVDNSKLESFCAKFNKVKSYVNYGEMLDKEELDGVIIATPHKSHIEIAKACVEKGVNYLLEKPIGVTVKQARELLDFEQSNVIGAMVFNQRTNRLYRKAK